MTLALALVIAVAAAASEPAQGRWTATDRPGLVTLEHRAVQGAGPDLRLTCRPDSAKAYVSLRMDAVRGDLLRRRPPWPARLRLEGGGKRGRIKAGRAPDAQGVEWTTGHTWVLRVELRSFRRTGVLAVSSGGTRRSFRAAPAEMAAVERFFDRCD